MAFAHRVEVRTLLQADLQLGRAGRDGNGFTDELTRVVVDAAGVGDGLVHAELPLEESEVDVDGVLVRFEDAGAAVVDDPRGELGLLPLDVDGGAFGVGGEQEELDRHRLVGPEAGPAVVELADAQDA